MASGSPITPLSFLCDTSMKTASLFHLRASVTDEMSNAPAEADAASALTGQPGLHGFTCREGQAHRAQTQSLQKQGRSSLNTRRKTMSNQARQKRMTNTQGNAVPYSQVGGFLCGFQLLRRSRGYGKLGIGKQGAPLCRSLRTEGQSWAQSSLF